MNVSVHPSLETRVGILALEIPVVRVASDDPALDEEIRLQAARLEELHRGKRSSQVDGTGRARDLYKALGIDPTKTRPSSEALLRRVLLGNPFPRINTLVDCVNLLSLRFLLPYGLYDLQSIRPPIELRIGKAGEGYSGIRKDRVNLEGRPALFDSEGPFGNPTSDSDRAKITLSTTAGLVVCFHPPSLPEAELERIRTESVATIDRFCRVSG